ncbi:MAG: (E)-4-hydroxy-3-methylbut-2-enyl-diphosphate synthase [Chlamydiales bacterium]|nr:(E)-4-hydroxy-3-methylbut-2-enyl-diphosphate synthase [Chlamydiales bacterium]
MKYNEHIFETKRWKTREVKVGKVGVGGDNTIRLQSMTTSNTRDVEATVEQIIRLADIGCEIARVTVQGMKEADACEGIKNGLLKRGYDIPLVADIHFYPPAAMRVVDFVDKVRINPGNFVDKRATFKTLEYDDASYREEIEKIQEGFLPLVEKCKRLKRSMRIGTNHGSLSDRIMNRYGDTAFGMVESALEFTRVCRMVDYHEIIFSMKASNPLVMMQAYRLLAAEMIKLGWDYPLHLGVTEAGEGEDGRVKSAVGIGALLLDGLGDTIRVSLTEDPWEEIDPCKRLKGFFEQYRGQGVAPFEEKHRTVKNIVRRKTLLREDAPLHRDGTVILKMRAEELLAKELFTDLACKVQLGLVTRTLATPDALLIDELPGDERYLQVVQKLKMAGIGILSRSKGIPGVQIVEDLQKAAPGSAVIVTTDREEEWERLVQLKPAFILFAPKRSRLHEGRRFFEWMQEKGIETPVLLYFSYDCDPHDLVIHAPAECGALLADGLGEGIVLDTPHESSFIRGLSFNILQAVRMRTSKTEFISCPGCGRTLFELQAVTKRIREKTSHLPGVKIAIMGCIVNGPGEMADADFGYVGSKKGKIDLYVGKTCVERDIDFANADERLIDLIKAHGRWVEPESTTSEVETSAAKNL